MMVHDASWADEIRDSRPETGAWHYVDIPLWAGSYDARRDCGDGNCVVAQIDDDLRILSNRHAPDAARAEALRFLIHFVADVHQPLHAEDNDDKGGNQVHVRLGRERANLHKLWDVDVVEPLGPDPDAIAESIEQGLSPSQRKDWQSGTPARWANEAHAIAREHIYPPLGGARDLRLPRDYAFREAPLGAHSSGQGRRAAGLAAQYDAEMITRWPGSCCEPSDRSGSATAGLRTRHNGRRRPGHSASCGTA